MQTILKSIVAALLLILGTQAQADTLLIEKVQRDAELRHNLPARGMSKATVASLFGEPREKIAPVGEPPISRWVYDDYVVYFERDLVLHTVARP